MRRSKTFTKSKKPKKPRTTPYNIPDENEIAKKKSELVKHMKKLNKDGTLIKKMTRAQEMSLIRSAIRQQWMYAPNKLAYLLLGVVPDLDENTRRKFKCQCEMCEEWFTVGDICIDHIIGEHSLKGLDDFDSFINSILYVGFDDLQRLCGNCHDLKSAMERYDLSEEDAIIFKRVTAWESRYKSAKQQQEYLVKHTGCSKADVSNKDKRRQKALEYFKDN